MVEILKEGPNFCTIGFQVDCHNKKAFFIDLASLAGGQNLANKYYTSAFIMIAWIENLAIRIVICE